ncbi:MAG: cyclic nucleotide-binding domain-containing protein [Chloroflexi bacterium]|nr:MAG: cyclic nucleotide-binding domain-containing protein [Chloroflexota bacterium]
MDVEAALAATPLLSSLDRKTIKRLAEQGKHRHYEAGETIVREGAPASALYIILGGKVHVERAEGDGAPVALLGPGDFFGELALIEEHPRSASVVADTPTDCILFVAWEFTALLKEYPEMAIPLMNALIARLHRREQHLIP